MHRRTGIVGPVLFIFLVLSVGLSRPAPAAKYVYPGDRQWIYCAEQAEMCYLYCTDFGVCPKPDTMFVFIRAADSCGRHARPFSPRVGLSGLRFHSVRHTVPRYYVLKAETSFRDDHLISR